MKWGISKLIETFPSKLVGVYRIVLGILFLVTGTLKLYSNNFSKIWATQLKEIQIPFFSLFFYGIPFYELLLGSFLVAGFYSRICAILILPLMFVAIYTYITVYNSNGFFFQPYDAYYPIMIIMLALIVFIYGGGRWSMDLRIQRKHGDFGDSGDF